MNNNQRFDTDKFNIPDVSCAPVYIWVWNDVCTREIIDTQLAEMKTLGIRAFYILPEPKQFRPDSMPTNLEPAYLSGEYFELCAYAAEKAAELGMTCWIYDEGGWPSGGACGKVMKDHPEFARETLGYCERSFSAGDVYKKSAPDVLAAFINDKEIIREGYTFISDSVVTEYFTKKDTNSNYPDLLNRAATDYFIEITHRKYSLNNITAVFTDEPKAPADAFNNELAEKYESAYGESVLPYLPLLAGRVDATEENVHILHRWYDICSRTFCENYLMPCKKWANDNGIAFTGHLDKDHDPLGCIRGGGNFNLMRALRCFDIPGIDVIWRQLYPDNKIDKKDDMNGYNGFYPRYASSAAAQNGTKYAMSEILGVAGAAVTYDIMRYTVGYQVVRGINIFNPFNVPLGRKGALLAQELPVYTESQPYYDHLSQFNRYTERLSYIASLGERVCEAGLYYPVCDILGRLNAESVADQFDKLGRALEEKTTDFDIVDDDVIQMAQGAEKGCLSIGKAKYRHIIIPKGAFIPSETRKVLNLFAENGGRVSYDVADTQPVIQYEGQGLRAVHRKAENADIFCLFRETGENGDYLIHLPQANGYLLDAHSGKIQQFNAEDNALKISLAVGETAIVMLTDEILDAEERKTFSRRIEINNKFTLRREYELTCDENGFKKEKHSDEGTPGDLGDWSAVFGKAYSGSGVYETEFTVADKIINKSCAIDLGDVRFTAEVHINGQLIGSVLAPPYRLTIPDGILKKHNKLKIVVTNTSANWYSHTDYFDKWRIKELSPYFEVEKKYAEDYVSGGLYGPVALFTE